MTHLSKRIFSLCMALVMLVMLIPQAALAAPDVDPEFRVEYHAWVTDYAKSGSNEFKVLNTEGANLPTNKDTRKLPTKSVYFDKEIEGEIETTEALSEIFKARDDFSYYTAPGLHYIDQVSHFNGNYLLKEIWICLRSCGKLPMVSGLRWVILPSSLPPLC